MTDLSAMTKFLNRIEHNLDRLSSIWDDIRIRGNVRKDYPELAEAIDRLLETDDDNE